MKRGRTRREQQILMAFCQIALRVEQEKKKEQPCDCCKSKMGSYIYVIKIEEAMFFHICSACKEALEAMNTDNSLMIFINKD